MIDSFAVVPKPAFHNLTHQSIETYLNKLPKASRLYVLAASHGEGINPSQPFHSNSNQLAYYAFSLVNKKATDIAVNKLLEACAYLDFRHALIIIVTMYDKIGIKALQQHLSEYLLDCQRSQHDVRLAKMQVFINRLSLFLTIFALERISQDKSSTTKEAY